ncbi:MAG: heme exporter protein CcmB [Fimbriimonas sp.]|nr:heme exporter protein CcmB [Fimbriimonas sp.]
MNSSWRREVEAIFRKEWRTEMRSQSGLVTGLLFSVVTVYAISFASLNATMTSTVVSGMLWVALLFSSSASLPRIFLSEEELGTGDLLRLTARPHAIFWGKSLFNCFQCVVTGTILSVLYLGFTSKAIAVPWLFAVSLVAGCLSLAGAVTLCGAIASQAANRAVLSAAIAVPLLLPLVSLGVSAVRVSLGLHVRHEDVGSLTEGIGAAIGLVGYAGVTLATGPWIYSAVWRS